MSIDNLLPNGSVKFRETSADSVVFHTIGHTPELPRTMTITRTLPVPRKGNAGTAKIVVSLRVHEDIGTPEAPNVVPIISKFSTSCPVGSKYASMALSLNMFAFLLDRQTYGEETTEQAREDLFLRGYLLDNTGAAPASSYD
jgi:hypothetical protein